MATVAHKEPIVINKMDFMENTFLQSIPSDADNLYVF